MAARDKNIFSILLSELNPSDSDDDDESIASSEDEYVSSDELDSKEEYIEKDLRCREELNQKMKNCSMKRNAYMLFIRINMLPEMVRYGRQLFHKGNTISCAVELDQKIYSAFQ